MVYSLNERKKIMGVGQVTKLKERARGLFKLTVRKQHPL